MKSGCRGPDALIQWSATNDALVRAIAQEAVQVDAPKAITGISSAFYSAGTILGEGETQVFLKTDKGQPMSLSILSRPGQAKSWAVSTAEVIGRIGNRFRPGTHYCGTAWPAACPAI